MINVQYQMPIDSDETEISYSDTAILSKEFETEQELFDWIDGDGSHFVNVGIQGVEQ